MVRCRQTKLEPSAKEVSMPDPDPSKKSAQSQSAADPPKPPDDRGKPSMKIAFAGQDSSGSRRRLLLRWFEPAQ
jgi:hypothetical protein